MKIKEAKRGQVTRMRWRQVFHNLSVSSPFTPTSRGLCPRTAALRLSSAKGSAPGGLSGNEKVY